MGKIHRLGSELVNQIAAGEVVERPASVVKELIENALDAGASRVRVDIEQGGLDLVRVTDDGEGMERDDALLALERHATSKIERFDDLARLGTFGFRGEALPSIASVSKLTLLTRRAADEEATEVAIQAGGAGPRAKPAARGPGTAVEVRELFFNVPARRKFLRSAPTESAHVSEAVLGAALACSDVTFVLSRDGKVVREFLRAGSRRERALQALGEPRLIACEGERGPMFIEAHLSPPERGRSGAGGLHLLVNGRPVRDRALARAVAQAYGSVLEGGRYPVGVVYVELPKQLVDVNVHPQKAEVRFEDGRALFDAVTRSLYDALSKVIPIPALGPASRPWLPPPQRSYAGGGAMFALHEPATTPSARFEEGELAALVSRPPESLVEGPFGSAAPSSFSAPSGDPSLFAQQQGFYTKLRFVAQLRATFLVCEGDDALYVVDQHAADERRNFDRLRKAFEARAVAVQKLLVPEVVELTPQEAAAFAEHEEVAARLGVEVRSAGPSAVAVHGVPALLSRARPERLLRDLLAELSRAAGRPFSGAVDLVLATMACHGSVRAGDALSAEQAQALLGALDGVDFSGHCPHGRPVLLRIPFSELERRVGR